MNQQPDKITALYCRLSQDDALDGGAIPSPTKRRYCPNMRRNTDSAIPCFSWTTDSQERIFKGPDFRK